jgi:hypothetical protein
MVKFAKKISHTCSHNHIYGINKKKTYSKVLKLSLWSNGGLYWVYDKLHIKCEEF